MIRFSTLKQRIQLALVAFIASFLIIPIPLASAAGCLRDDVLGVPTWYKYFDAETDASGRCTVKLPTQRDQSGEEVTDVSKTVGRIAVAATEILLRIASFVAVGYIIYGGYRFILSQGDPENAKSARQTVINALIGLVISIAAGAIVSFVMRRLI